MANNFSLSSGPEIEAVQVVVDAIRATDFPTTDALIGAVDAVVDAIRGTDVPVITAAIAGIETTGQFKKAFLSLTSTGWTNVLNIASGKGKLLLIITNADAAVTGKLRITIDGILSSEFTLTQNETNYIIYDVMITDNVKLIESATPILINTDYNVSLKVEMDANAGTVKCMVLHCDNS